MSKIRQSRDAIKKIRRRKVAGYAPLRKLEKHDISSSVFLRSRIPNACEIISQLSRRFLPDKRKKTHTAENYSVDLFLEEGGGGRGGTGERIEARMMISGEKRVLVKG